MKFIKKKKKKKRGSNVANNLFFVLTLSSLIVIIFVFHLFLYKQIESLSKERISVINRIEELKNEAVEYKVLYKEKFDQYEKNIANVFYGQNRWRRQAIIKNQIILD